MVYGALSTHRQTDPAALTIPLSARSVIYETKGVRGFWLNRWFGARLACGCAARAVRGSQSRRR